VDLAHDQPAADVERDVQGRGVGLRHLQPVQWYVRAVVDDLSLAGPEPQRQKGAGEQQDDEAVERDLAEHERPVVGEHLARTAANELGRAKAFVDLVGDVAGSLFQRWHGVYFPRSQKLGPTGSWKSCAATR